MDFALLAQGWVPGFCGLGGFARICFLIYFGCFALLAQGWSLDFAD
jgi:hypothetical protein